jgi:hypothetical protein
MEHIQVFAVSGVAVTAMSCVGMAYAAQYPWVLQRLQHPRPRRIAVLLMLLSHVALVAGTGLSYIHDTYPLLQLHAANLLGFVGWCHLFFALKAYRIGMGLLVGNVGITITISILTRTPIVIYCMLLHALWLLFLLLLTFGAYLVDHYLKPPKMYGHVRPSREGEMTV